MNKILKFLLTFSILSNTIIFCADPTTDTSCCASNTCTSCATCGDCNSCCLGKCDGYPYLQIRSQGRNSARQIVGIQQFVNRYDMDSTYGQFSLIAEYSQSFAPERLTNFLFGNDLVGCKELYIQGSQVANRNSKAWLADYFGLPTDFESRISFCPKVQNAIFDMNFYLGLDELAEGLFFKINMPLVYSKWNLSACEKVVNAGVNNFSAGYMSTGTITRDNLASNFLSTMNGTYKFGDMQSPIRAGRFVNKCDCSKTKIAEIDLILGWNFVLQEDYNFGISLCAAVPTGNSPSSLCLFEPIVGNGKHWEFGAGFNGSWIFHRSKESADRYIGLWFDATITHLFNACQCRSFDFCNKPNSRYMLLEIMGDNNDVIKADVNDDETTALYQYTRSLIPAVNWSTFSVDVRIDVQADVVAKIGFLRDNWSFDLGYNFWARSGERFCDNRCNNDTNIYAIKGDTWLYGVEIENNVETTKYPLSAAQSKADIHAGTNYPAINPEIRYPSTNLKTNPGIDNPYLAQFGTNDTPLYAIGTENQINTSINPVIVTRKNLNLGKSPSSLSNKAFWHLGYEWKDKEGDYVPFLGLGGEVEFAQDNYKDCCCCKSCQDTCNNTCDNNCTKSGACDSCCESCCPRGGVSSWGLWIKGGLAFD